MDFLCKLLLNDSNHKIRSLKETGVLMMVLGYSAGYSVIIALIIGYMTTENLKNNTLGVLIGLVGFIAVFLVLFRMFRSYCLKASACPQCGEIFCTNILNEKTLAESVVREKSGQGKTKYTNYRVGVKLVELECQKCGFKDKVEARYKEAV